jgi:hypothetical protein
VVNATHVRVATPTNVSTSGGSPSAIRPSLGSRPVGFAPPPIAPLAREVRNTSEPLDPNVVALPDLGDGVPFESVAMTPEEAQALVSLVREYSETQRNLEARRERGEIAHGEMIATLIQRGNELQAELVTLMGEERVAILGEEIRRYAVSLATHPEGADFTDFKSSALYQAMEGDDETVPAGDP